MNKNRPSIFFVATTEFSVNSFLINHLRILSSRFDLTVFVATLDINFLSNQGLDVKVIPLNISRKISFFSDLICLVQLILYFLINRPSAVHSITPKAGLLAMIASSIARIPIKIHTFTGQVWIEKKGIYKKLLIFTDYLTGSLANFNIIDSLSQRDFLVQNKVLSRKKTLVFGSGSVSGVNLNKFTPSKKNFIQVRNELSIPKQCFVFIFLGRLNIDKGVIDLATAFSKIPNPNAYLIFVGPDEEGMVPEIKFINKNKLSNIRFIGFTSEPERYLAASNALCLPSYREGFGNVIIEAGAMAIPAIASNIYGISDAIINGKTGLLHSAGNVKSIFECLEKFLNNPTLSKKYGIAAKDRVRKEFDSKLISKCWRDFYMNLIL